VSAPLGRSRDAPVSSGASDRTAPLAGWPEDALEVGRIVDAWGIKGWLKVQPFSADPQTLLGSRTWFVQPPERGPGPAPGARSTLPLTLAIRQARMHGDAVVAQADGCDDRAAAEALRGVRIFVARSSFPPAGDDEFYWVDLIGLDVVNRQGERLGRVVGLIDTGPQSVLRVVPEAVAAGSPAGMLEAAPDVADALSPSGAAAAPASKSADERLIPFVAAYVDDVDLAARRITVDWGLDY
jgi:16S rRNA processing protein RimM